MKPNPIKEALAEAKVILGTMIVQVRSPAIMQLLAEYGLDYVMIDMEHGSYTVENAADLIQTARLAGISPIVRVADIRYDWYSRLLDAGAQGMMTPRVNTAEQVRQIVQFTKYPPMGERGFSRLAAHVNFAEIDFHAYVQWANENIVNLIQVESKQGVENLAEMIAVPGVDGVLVGMDDLALSLGVAGNTQHPLAEQALAQIVATCEAQGMPWGLHIPESARLIHWLERGMTIATYSSDVWMMQDVLRENVPRLRAAGNANKISA